MKKRASSTIFSKFIKVLGPGLITGASDDDPSGITTYTQAGATLGLSTLWTALVTFPLMAAIQGMCARIGIVTKMGLTGTLKANYHKSLLYIMILFSFPAITLNIGADIAGMGAVANLLVPAVNAKIFSLCFALLLMVMIIYFPYKMLAAILKWLCLSLLLYLIVPFLVKQNWAEVARNTFVPAIQFNKQYISMLVAILGTTISPYLFFWQATMEAEEAVHNKRKIIVNKHVMDNMKRDVDFGIFFSCLVMYFINLTAGSVLFNAGVHTITTVEQAATALKPLAGEGAYFLFAIGVIGTGFLAIPVLAGSLSYQLSETFDWKEGLDNIFSEAKGFYITMIVSVLIGLSLDFIGISPIQALLYTAILYGLTAPVLIAIIMHICNNKKVMGEFTNKPLSNILGVLTFVLMSAAAIALIYLTYFG